MTTNTQVYIAGRIIDLYPDTIIAKTLQSFDIFNVGNVKANFTNQLRAPKTENNRLTFGFSDQTKTSSQIPYQQLNCTIVQNGAELISNGYAIVRQTDSSYNIVVYDGNYNFFNLIATLTVQDLWNSIDTAFGNFWDTAAIATASNVSSGIVSVMSDQNQLDHNGVNYVTTKADSTPAIYYKDLITKLFTSLGFTLSGNINSDSYFTKMIVPLQNFLNKKLFSFFEFSASAAGGQAIVTGAGTDVQFTQVALNPNGLTGLPVYDGTSLWTMRSPIVNDIIYCNFRTDLNVTVTGTGTAFVELIMNGVNVASVTIGVGANQQISINSAGPGGDINTYIDTGGGLDLIARNQTVHIVVINASGANTVTINSGTFYNKCPYPTDKRQWFSAFHPSFMLPDIKIVDLIKEFSLQFGLLFNQVKGTVFCRNIDEIINDTANSQDWTNKRDKSVQEQVVFQFSNFAQTNIVNWNNNADTTLSPLFLNGTFTIPNINLSATLSKTSLFSSSDMGGMYPTTTPNKLGLYCLRMKTKTVTGFTFVKDTGFRVCLVRDSVGGTLEPTGIKIGVNTIPDPYKVAYFNDAKQSQSLSWQALLNKSYTQFITRLQQGTKMVTRAYYLNDADINQFDPLKLVHDDGEYFIVNQIKTYVPGVVTNVEMFKI